MDEICHWNVRGQVQGVGAGTSRKRNRGIRGSDRYTHVEESSFVDWRMCDNQTGKGIRVGFGYRRK
jgi:hypothetical protein